MEQEWSPDILGDGFEQQTLPLGEDKEGPVVATIVRRLPKRHFGPQRPYEDVDVLYVHGWSDYFFNRRFARYWTDRGAHFYALDLRKYGRSMREWHTPGFITDLNEYDEELTAAFGAMGRAADGTGKRRLVLIGHSTGGLTLSLWVSRHPGVVSALILNSPWLEFQLSAAARTVLAPVLNVHSLLRPHDNWPQVDLGYYTRAQAEVADPDDPMDVVEQWRPARAMKVHLGWINAVTEGHARVSYGLAIDVPVHVMLSARTVMPTHWSDDLTRADTVLVVDNIARAALKLGQTVTIDRIDGALHDVFLSRAEVRNDAYARMDRWARAFIGLGGAGGPRGWSFGER